MPSERRRALAAAVGLPPSREIVVANDSATKQQRRAARRAVSRGEAVQDPVVARLAVATARERLRIGTLVPAATVRLLGFAALLWLVVGVVGLIRDGVGVDAGYSVVAGAVLAYVGLGHRRALARAARAQERNRAVLERAGEPYVIGPLGLERPARRRGFAAAAVAFAFYAVGFGVAVELLEDGPFTLVGALAYGLTFAVLMTCANRVLRQRGRRSTEGSPVS